MFDVYSYENSKGEVPIQEYLLELKRHSATDKRSRVLYEKIYHYIGMLSRFGTKAGEKYTKYIGDDLWELRPIDNRIFFFYWKDNKFVLLHFFHKKTQKTPKKEIQQARSNMEDFLRRNK